MDRQVVVRELWQILRPTPKAGYQIWAHRELWITVLFPSSAVASTTSILGRGRHIRKAWQDFMAAKKGSKRWVAAVKTDSTHPPAGLFTKDAATIVRTLASKRVSPKGRMLTYFINRDGRNLTARRRRELEKAKTLLSKRIHSRKRARAA